MAYFKVSFGNLGNRGCGHTICTYDHECQFDETCKDKQCVKDENSKWTCSSGVYDNPELACRRSNYKWQCSSGFFDTPEMGCRRVDLNEGNLTEFLIGIWISFSYKSYCDRS